MPGAGWPLVVCVDAAVPQPGHEPVQEQRQAVAVPVFELVAAERPTGGPALVGQDGQFVGDVRVAGPARRDEPVEVTAVLVVDPGRDLVQPRPHLLTHRQRARRRVPRPAEGLDPTQTGAALDQLRAERGLAPDPDLAALQRGLVLSPFPPSFRDPASPLPATAHSFRAPLRSSGAERDSLPSWWARLEGRPVVHVTLGTVFATESGDLFPRLLTGLGQLPVEVVVTVGRDIDPVEFGLQPEHVHVEQWVPQSLLLPHTDLVVSHGGSGTVIAALAHGLPQVVLAMGADQMHNADRVQALGVGRALHPVTTKPAEIRDTVAALLTDDRAQSAAQRIQREITALPGPDSALSLLEAQARHSSKSGDPTDDGDRRRS
jgi:UDP:flavonoid glycosyltransferase YjiC (YdhE family)